MIRQFLAYRQAVGPLDTAKIRMDQDPRPRVTNPVEICVDGQSACLTIFSTRHTDRSRGTFQQQALDFWGNSDWERRRNFHDVTSIATLFTVWECASTGRRTRLCTTDTLVVVNSFS
jgi:hypothetical protein